jgi:hypothetical protein
MSTTTPPTQAYARLEFLLGAENPKWNGIDYVEIASDDETKLRVHFLTRWPVAPGPPGTLTVTITGGETIGSVPVLPVNDWSVDADGRPVLSLAVAAPGDFSPYTLTISGSATLDPYFDAATFTFKANCPSDFDCAAPVPSCPPDAGEPVPIDYLAKDFDGFKRALSDFSALRYPNWVERSEADVGIMVMEALSAVADELSYYQDRVAAEATLATATQRVSLVRHARLVDYEPAAATSARTVLQLEVGSATPVPAGLRCSALGADGRQIPFEVGDGLVPSGGPVSFAVNPAWNAGPAGARNLEPYWWDASRQCLPAGSTRIWLVGVGHELTDAQQLLIDTAGATSADPPVREVVTIATGTASNPSVDETADPVFLEPVTRIDLDAATTVAHDLGRTHLAGNLVPAVQGERMSETFVIPGAPPPPGSPTAAPAIVRTGANSTPELQVPAYRYTLATGQLSWLPTPAVDPDTSAAVDVAPQLLLSAATAAGAASWGWQRSLLAAGPETPAFTLTPERYSPVGTGTVPAASGSGVTGVQWFDYDGEGVTIAFGDGRLGALPPPGTVFTATYLAGGGSVGNVPADAIVTIDQHPPTGGGAAPQVNACTNPFGPTGGADQETDQQIRDRAPQAFRAEPLRAVLPSDYVAAAQSESWVQQAGTTFRWTGSWLTVFTTADPAGAEQPTVDELTALSDLLGRRRLAGYESYVLPPLYASVDLRITVVAGPTAFASDVAAAVLAALQPGTRSDGRVGFFDHSRWGFGQPLESSALLAAIQDASGVAGAVLVEYRQRGVQPQWTTLPEAVTPPPDRILRVDNDRSRPEAGSIRVIVEGGK